MGGITLARAEPAAVPSWAQAPPKEEPPVQLGPRRLWLVFSGLLLALLLAALEQMMVAVALPEIAGELHGPDRMPWALTAYLLAAAVALPVHNRCGDLHGHRRAFRLAVVLFVAGSALAGWSRTMDQLIAFRALQGAGAGGLLAGVQAITAEIVPARARGRFLGLIGAAFGLGSVAGPLLGGYVTDHLSWRWCFHVNVPCGLVVLAAVALVPKSPKPVAKGRLDVLGALLLAAASTCLVLLTGWGGTQYAWDSRVILGLAAGAAVATALFLAAERRAAQPLVPLRLFNDSVFHIAGLVGLATGAALLGAGSCLPAYLQLAGGATATEAGLLMLPLTAGMVGASVVVGQLVRRTGHYRTYPVLGTALSVAGMGLLSRLDAGTPRLHFGLWTALLGAGIGMVMPVLVLAVQNSVRPADAGTATSAHDFLRQLGGGAGVALCGALVADRLAGRLPTRAGTGLPAALRDTYVSVYADAVPRAFLLLVPVLGLGLLLAFFLKCAPPASPDAPAEPAPSAVVPPVRSPCAREVAVRGTVRHHDGTVVPRAALTLIDATGLQIGRGAGGEDGRYALAAPGAGSYVLVASVGGHQPQATTVTVGERPVELDMVLGGAGRLAGRVVTADGCPLRDASLTLTDVRGQVVATTRSGTEGDYAITDLMAGRYTLSVGAHTFRAAVLPVTVRSGRESRQDIELEDATVLSGTVRTGDGRPVEDARVTLLDLTGAVVGTLTTGTDGAYHFADLSSGEYTVIASGYPPVATALRVTGGGRTERDLELGYEDLGSGAVRPR